MTHNKPSKFAETFLGQAVLVVGSVGAIFGGVVYLQNVKADAEEAKRIVSEYQAKLKILEDKLNVTPSRDEFNNLRDEEMNLRMSFENNLRTPDVVIRYGKNKKR